MSKVNFNNWLAALSEASGVNCVPDEDNLVILEVEDGLNANLQYQENLDSIYIFYELGTVNSKALPTLAVKMLNANLFGLGTGGGTLALDEETLEVVFSYRMDLPKENARLTQIFENTMNVAASWKDEITLANKQALEEESENLNSNTMPFNMMSV